LIDATVDKLWIAQNGTIGVFEEDLDFYQRLLTASGNPRNSAQKSGPGSQEERRRERQEAASRRAGIAPLRKAIRDAEQKLSRLRQELEKIDAILDDPTTYGGAPDRVATLGRDKARYEAEIARVEESWLEMSAELEEAERAGV
jgi:ATP-binding cassette subfamily F protein 3